MARSIATNRRVDLDTLLDFIRPRHRLLLATTRTDGRPQLSPVTGGCDAEGRLTALDFDGLYDTGAYASWGPTVAGRVPVHASGPYRVPHVRARARAVFTHQPPSGAFRGFGVPQAAIAQEALALLEVDGEGLERIDRELLRTIVEKFDGGPVGLSTLAVSLGEETDTIEDVYEPFLLQLGFLDRTSQGRVATESAREHLRGLGYEVPPPRRAERSDPGLWDGVTSEGRSGTEAQA